MGIQIRVKYNGVKVFGNPRTIPVVVVVYRVMMVCHVDFCYTRGEKQIRDQLCRWTTFFLEDKILTVRLLYFSRFCLLFPMMIGGISVLHHVNLRYMSKQTRVK